MSDPLRPPVQRMLTTPSPRIPLELCEEVVECLPVKNDPGVDVTMQDRYFTLRQCALVCRAWLPFARSCIFRVVHLSFSDGPQLLQLLNLNPALAHFITEVIVDVGCGRFDGCSLDLVAELAQRLTEAKALTLVANGPNSEEHTRKLEESILPILQAPTLRNMTLQGITFAEENFLQLISIPLLATLSLENVRLLPKSDNQELVPAVEHRLAISSLALHSQDAVLVGWLLRPSCPIDVPALKALSIRVEDVGNMQDFLPLLDAIGSSLKVLELQLPALCVLKKYHRFSSIIDAIPTIPNTHIEHITVCGFDRRDPHPSSIGLYSKQFDGAELVKCLLLRLPAPQCLQTLTICEDVEIQWYSPSELKKLRWHNWQAVDEVLGQASFSSIKHLEFVAGLNSLELQCGAVRLGVSPQFRAFRERIGTVFDLTVNYTSLAWRRGHDARVGVYEAKEYYLEKWGDDADY
ncbi:hypothetical protein C8R45DRAFT_1215987 [Mycena sanguinolenta]|nr:hypothetical protein C8R45DRAFT_1215987 [Mycena sanguinolenta]